MKRLILAVAAFAGLATTAPAAAQDGFAEDETASGFEDFLYIEPLTPEQEALMPLARRLAAVIIPEEMSEDGRWFPLIGVFSAMMFEQQMRPVAMLREGLGPPARQLRIDDADARLALAIIDPAWEERGALISESADLMQRYLLQVAGPNLREAIAETFVIEFDEPVLRDLEVFFATDSGRQYARQSMGLGNGPRFLSALATSFENPQGTEVLQAEMETIEERTAQLPPVRQFAELTPEQLARLSALTGLTEEEIEESMTFEWELENWEFEDSESEANVGNQLYVADGPGTEAASDGPAAHPDEASD